jgi:hypothetical protein
MTAPILKSFQDLPRPPPVRVSCSECFGRGMIKLWPPGHQERACMARCEQCSGFGKVKA